jgi:hypothetical protein
MIKAALAAATFVIYAAVNPGTISQDGGRVDVNLSTREKTAILHPLIEVANECLVHAVASDPRLGKRDVTDLIVESFSKCTTPVRAMIDAHDRYYGAGSGERFFMGPYLDALPSVVTNFVGKAAR